MTSSFKERVLKIVSSISTGNTLSYKDVATRAGNPAAARAVGAIMHANHNKHIPCYRVVHTNGALGKYNKLLGLSKTKLLKNDMADIK